MALQEVSLEYLGTAVEFDPFADGELLVTAPATEAQKEIWASVRLGKEANCAYNESQTLRLQGCLNLEALQGALQSLVNRHEALRTTMSPDGNTLCIAAGLRLELPLIDLSRLDLVKQTDKVASLKRAAVEQPFDLEHGPLFRAELLKLHPQEHLLLLTAHHVICDGWSWGVLIPDLGKLYSALHRREIPDLQDPDRLSDYALQQEAEAASSEASATEAYWLQQFAVPPAALDLPTDRPRPAFRTFAADRQDYDLSADLANRLKQLGQASGCSLMTTLLASFEVLLHRLTGQEDLVVGVPTAGQAATGQNTLVGHCVNLLPLRTQIDGSCSFLDYLKAHRSSILDAYEHQQFTFGSLLAKLVANRTLPRDPGRIPLVSVLFNLDQGLESDRLPFAGLVVECLSNPRRFENFELYVNATEFQDRLTLEWQYNTNLFDAATIRRRILEFETLLQGIVADPSQMIDRLPLLPSEERQLLASWNQPQAVYPHDGSIQQLVEAQVVRSPEAVAVRWADRSLTYQELNQRANQLAHHLRQLGVGPNVLVGLCLERSFDLVVALLGILKAGGAYLPLDPTYPQERLAFMLEDAGAAVLLTQQALVANLPGPVPTVCLDRDWPAIAQSSPNNPPDLTLPTHLAYVIYTSGSTGKPKGVSLTHRLLVNLLAWQLSVSPPELGARTLQFAPVSFDISFQEVFSTLWSGGTLVLVAEAVRRDAAELLRLLKQQQITRLFLPFVALQNLAEVAESQGETCPDLREVITAGEQLQITRSIAHWFNQHPNCRLHNHYGPSETHVVTAYSLTGTPDSWMALPPIGRPIANTQIYLLNFQQQPVPIGVAGELCITVDEPVRAYINRPDLTQEKFIPNPFSPNPAARLYRTGDLARYRPDGNLEYLGRLDNQVKVRGFRIELGEVEAALNHCPTLREAVAMVREDLPGERRLVAYGVAQAMSAPPTLAEVRQFLKQKLPDYMLPTVFVLLDKLPLTPSGKVDRRALPLPDPARPDLLASYVAPRTPVEQQIAAVWAEILKLERIGIQDNFFELGGYSLLGTQVTARLRQIFGVELPLRLLFEAPTVAEFTEQVELLRWAAQSGQDSNSAGYEEGEL
jgi:amino acid adenylation domain-containing protein